MDGPKCGLCGKLLLFEEIEVTGNFNGKQIKIHLCKDCAEILFNRETFAVSKEFSQTYKTPTGSYSVQKVIHERNFKIPPEKVEKILFVFVGKKTK